MWDTHVGRKILRGSRNLLFVNLAILAALLLWAAISERYLFNVFSGPFPMTSEQLLQAPDPTSSLRYFVRISGVAPLDVGLEDIESTHIGDSGPALYTRSAARYFATPISQRLLLLRTSGRPPGVTCEGELVPIPSALRDSISAALRGSTPLTFDQLFLPYMLDASGFRTWAWFCILLALPLAALSLINIYKAIARLRNPSTSPSYAALQRFGAIVPMTAASIDAELNSAEADMIQEDLTLTPSWLVKETIFGVSITRIDEILWIYQSVTRHSYNFVPTGTSRAIVVCSAFGKRITIDLGRGAKEDAVRDLLLKFQLRVPWVAFGYDAGLDRAFTKARPQFADAISRRREQYLANLQR